MKRKNVKKKNLKHIRYESNNSTNSFDDELFDDVVPN